jgi:hypothetical protein
MSALALFTSDTFETGDLVCVDSTTGYAVPYDPEGEPSTPVIGAALVPENGFNPNGRQWFAINGNPYYENDMYIWQDDLTSDFVTANDQYAPFNPLTDSGYVTAITNGIAAVKSTISAGIPASWVLLRAKQSFNWYLVR